MSNSVEHRRLAVWALCALLSACATRDGPPAKAPPDVASVPDAQPQIEPIRPGGPNKPYGVYGHGYLPQHDDQPLSEKGLASWYGKKFHGQRTASGEVYNMYAMTAAHKTMPIPSYARVRNPANGREIIVRVNDRGPFHKDRIIDLSYAAALKLGVLKGVAPVEVERITHEQIRTGSWRRDAAPASVVQTPATPLPVAAAATPDEPPSPAFTSAAQGYWIQLGAFHERLGAEQLQRQTAEELSWLAPLLAVFNEQTWFRVQAGPYPTHGEAQDAANRVRDALKLVPMVIERRY